MIRKYARLEVLEAWRAGHTPAGLRKAAHRVAFEYRPRAGYLYVRSRMISSRTNDNHDTFPAGEIEKGYKSFLGKPVFVNHHNANHRRARGVIVAVALHRDRNPDHSPDLWVEGLMEIDAVRFPRLAKAIIEGKVNRTSMGVDVEWSRCSACGNKATSPAEYCRHLPALKGKQIRKRNQATGKVEQKLIHEICAGLSFFENSLLVEDPADPTAHILDEPDTRGMKMAASKVTRRPVPDHRGYWPLRSPEAAKKREGGDHPFFQAVPVSSANIVAAYHDSTDDEKALGDRWYSDAHHVAKLIGGGDAAKGAGLLSAYSPRTAWPINLFNASRASQGDPPGPGSGAMGNHQRSAMRILAGEHHTRVLVTPKTSAFAHLIEHGGDTTEDEASGKEKVVVDRHAISVAAGRRLTDEENDKAPLGQRQHYDHVAHAYREAAHILSKATGRKISPHQVQAATWLRQIRKNNEEDAAAKGTKGAAGKGRKVHRNKSQERWHEHHHHHYPEGLDEENMHHHGSVLDESWPEYLIECSNCGKELGEDSGGTIGSIPHLCDSCTRSMSPGQDRSGQMGRTRAMEPLRFSENALRRRSAVMKRLAYGETRVPPQVDTLRMEECPVCGEHDVWSGDRCPVCGFIVPPSLFRDPDVTKAQQVRDELDQQGEVVTQPGDPGDPSTQQIGSGEDAGDQMLHPDQIAPDGVPTVQGEGGPAPAAGTDGQPPAAQEPGQEEQAEGEAEEEQGEEDQEQGAEEEAEGRELEQQGEEDELEPEPQGGLVCNACGATFAPDMAAQPGVPCPACHQGALEPAGGPPEGAEDPSGEEDEDEREAMPGSKTAATLAQVQASRIAELTARNEVLEAQLSFLAKAAGADRHLEAIRQQVMKRYADMLNPASPVPDPPQGPPTQTTEQALMAGSPNPGGQGGSYTRGTGHTEDDPSRPGTTPGSVSNVPAASTTTAITPGVELQTPPATQLIDVTAPIQGTNPSQDGGVPLEQRRIETDVRIDPDPLKAHGPGIGGQGDNGSAFPWMLDARQPGGGQPGQQKAASLQQGATNEDQANARLFASMRLARLRVQAGMAHGDELVLGQMIASDQTLATPLIEHEINVLSQQRLTAPAPRPMPRQAVRQAPSLSSVGSLAYAPAAMAVDDLDGSDIFLD